MFSGENNAFLSFYVFFQGVGQGEMLTLYGSCYLWVVSYSHFLFSFRYQPQTEAEAEAEAETGEFGG